MTDASYDLYLFIDKYIVQDFALKNSKQTNVNI